MNHITGEVGYILVADDSRINRIKLAHMLEQQGHILMLVADGQQALEMAQTQPFDLVLLDIIMPELDGYQVLEQLQANPQTRQIPVIVISAADEMESIIRCIKMGAEDFLPKPFDPILLRARIDAILEKKRLRDREKRYLHQLQMEKEKSERLLLNILPEPIAEELKRGQRIIADTFHEVTVLFADIVGFTSLSSRMSPTDLVKLLNRIFSTFDQLAVKHGLEKIKTIGDAYMIVCGVPMPRSDHAQAIAEMALEMQQKIRHFRLDTGEPLQMRIGINTGPVVAGVIGTHKFSYDLWGDTVNTASRMETHSIPGRIQVTPETYACLRDTYDFEPRGGIEIKGKGQLETFFLVGRKANAYSAA